MTSVKLSRNARVQVTATVHVPLSLHLVWGRMRDFAWFTTLDPFHARVRVLAPHCRVGAGLIIDHRFLFIRIVRVGRILRWVEGAGYCFSDLSARGARRGFPHIYSYQVYALNEHASCIEVSVTGRWTANRLPRWLTKLWLRFVMAHAAARIRIAMTEYQAYLALRRTAHATFHP